MQIDLAELRARVDAEYRQTLAFIERMEKMFRAEASAPVAVAVEPKSNGAAPRPISPKAHPVRTATTTGNGTRKPRQASGRAIQVGLQLREPFNTAQLAAALGVSENGASSQVHRWKREGWVSANVPGQFTRTRAFGGATAQSSAMLADIKRDIETANPRA